MTSKWVWFVLAALWFAVAGFNAYQQRGALAVGFNVFAGVLFLFLALCRHRYEKKGAQGEATMKRIEMAVLALAAVLFFLVFGGVVRM